MKQFFRCDVKNIKQNGIEVLNALVVTQIRYGTKPTEANVEYEVSEKNKGLDIMGKRYIVEADVFEAVDEDTSTQEPTQLDRIEASVSYVESVI